MVDESLTRRPLTTTAVSARTSSRRSLAASYLDLKPLPEDVLLEGSKASFDSNDRSVISKSWDEEGENIRRNVLSRLPSSKSLDDQDKSKASSAADSTLRPQTAPVNDSNRKPFNREGLLLSSSSARSARYLAIQWRSRATQLSISSKSLGDAKSVESPPSATRVSDDGSSDSTSVHSSDSDYSEETMDESIISQVSDAQKVVEKWQQRWNERSESMSFCSESASRDEEEERGTNNSDQTQKAGNVSSAVSTESDSTREEILPDGLQFALKPTLSERALLTDENDGVKIESALKPYPLQAVPSGKEFLSDSQKNLGTFMEEEEEESANEEEEQMSTSQNSVFVMNDSGVIETIEESLDEESATSSVENTEISPNDHTKTDNSLNNDDHLSHASSSKAIEQDDELSEHSTTEQSAHLLDRDLNETNISFETQTTQKSIVNTFCDVPETFVPKQTQPPSNELSAPHQTPEDNVDTIAINSPKPMHPSHETLRSPQPPENDIDIDETPKVTHCSSRKVMEKVEKEEKPQSPPSPPQSPKIVALKKKNTEYTGSVQERIDAVKRAREIARKKKKKGTSSSAKKSPSRSKKSRPLSAEKTEKSKSPENKIKWTEHNVVFTFGLLTSPEKAPPRGVYRKEDDESTSYKNKLITKSKLLYEIMDNFGEIIRRTKSLGNGSTKYMMCSHDCTPRPLKVQHDGELLLAVSSLVLQDAFL